MRNKSYKNIEPGHRIRKGEDNTTIALVTGFWEDHFYNTGVTFGDDKRLTCQLHRCGFQIERVPFSDQWEPYLDPEEVERLKAQ